MSKPSKLKHLLIAAQFSREYVKTIDKYWRNCRGYMLTIDDPNVLSIITKDFTTNSEFGQSILSTNMPFAYLVAETEESEMTVDDLLLKDLRTKMIGPGFHRHKVKQTMALCCESIEPASTTTTSISKYLNRFALVSKTSMDEISTYLAELEKLQIKEETIRRFVTSEGNTWSRDSIPARKAESVFLGPLFSEILVDLEDFLSDSTREFYLKHGIPYVRTYLFHGHPGNGKTSCIKALASVLKLNLYSLNVASSRMDDNGLVEMVQGVMKRSIVAIEDVDRMFNNHTENQTASSVSFSTLLNVLDGILSKDGIVFVLTCNNKDQMDEALHRCGRIHSEYEFKDATPKIAEEMYLSFRPEEGENAKKFGKLVKTKRDIPVAAIQEFLVKNRKRPFEDADTTMLSSRRKLGDTMLG